MMALILFGILTATYLMLVAKRVYALIRAFRYQSFCLFLATLAMAIYQRHGELYIVAVLLFVVKVVIIPQVLSHVVERIKAREDIGLFINAQLSLVWALVFTYLAWTFTVHFVSPYAEALTSMLAVSFFVVLAGAFLMIFRMTAIAQIVGLLVMENGLFLLASTVSGGMPFFVEIAIFFDVLMSVLIMGFFVYRISKLFTHIDVDKLSQLKG